MKLKWPHPIRAWKEAGGFDHRVYDSYKPGSLAPLDMPIGMQGSLIFMWGMIFFAALLIGWIVYVLAFA